MADTLDVLTLAEGRAAVGADPATVDADQDARLAEYITATSRWIETNCGPVVSRELAALDTTTATVTLELTNGTDAELAAIREWHHYAGTITVGTLADHDATATRRTITAYDPVAKTVTLDGNTLTTVGGTSMLRAGLYLDTASVAVGLKVAATAYLRWLWSIERGAEGAAAFEGFGITEPFNTPSRVMGLLGPGTGPGWLDVGELADTRANLTAALVAAVSATPRVRVSSTPTRPGSGSRAKAVVTVGAMSATTPPDMLECPLTIDVGALADWSDSYGALDDLIDTIDAALPINWTATVWTTDHSDTLSASTTLLGFGATAPAAGASVTMEDTTATMEDTTATMENA